MVILRFAILLVGMLYYGCMYFRNARSILCNRFSAMSSPVLSIGIFCLRYWYFVVVYLTLSLGPISTVSNNFSACCPL